MGTSNQAVNPRHEPAGLPGPALHLADRQVETARGEAPDGVKDESEQRAHQQMVMTSIPSSAPSLRSVPPWCPNPMAQW